jgi:hypothetical protein
MHGCDGDVEGAAPVKAWEDAHTSTLTRPWSAPAGQCSFDPSAAPTGAVYEPREEGGELRGYVGGIWV